MQMHDTLRHVQGGTVVADLATAFDTTPAQAEAVMRAVMPELAWHLERNTLSRGGLADLVAALGQGHHARYLDGGNIFRDAAAVEDGKAILGHILGSKEGSRALAAEAAARAGLPQGTVRAMLPGLAALTMAGLAARSRTALAQILAVIPPLGHWSEGSPHADLAAILRRRCGVGPYASGVLRHTVRRVVARAAGFPPRGPIRWYVDFMLARPALKPVRRLAAQLTRTRPPSHHL
jgi:Bacterial protein of unknown function (DUF937)